LKQNLKKYYEKFQQHSNKIQKELDAVDAPQDLLPTMKEKILQRN
jgi:hypothetical protein